MIEVELKAVVDDLEAARQRAETAGARRQFVGVLEDRRYDRGERELAARDEVLRLRIYRPSGGGATASLDWKGPTAVGDGYKQREETSTEVGDADASAGILSRLGYFVTMAIDREIWQYELAGAVVRFERYPRMDDLVEVEGKPAAIERAISILELPRDSFTAERLLAFVARYEARTGERAALSAAELAGTIRYDARDA